MLLTSSYEYPGRYARWTVGFTAPALKISGKGLSFELIALNERGRVLVDIIFARLQPNEDLFEITIVDNGFKGIIKASNKYFPEENRSKQPSLFSVIRIIRDIFQGSEAGQLGLYGALGYDLAFQFEPVQSKKARDPHQQDLLLYLPDEIVVLDNQKKNAWKVKYEFLDEKAGKTTTGLPRVAQSSPYLSSDAAVALRDNEPGDYSNWVSRAKEEFRVGNLFEVVLTQIFREKLTSLPSEVFRR